MTEILKFFGKPESTKRPFLFTYWGTEKRRDVGGGVSGDNRHEILKENTNWYG